MTGAMTNPMNEVLRLRKEKLLLRTYRQESLFSYRELWLISIVFTKGRKEDVKNWTSNFVLSNSAKVILKVMRKYISLTLLMNRRNFLFSTGWLSSTPSYFPNWSVACCVYNKNKLGLSWAKLGLGWDCGSIEIGFNTVKLNLNECLNVFLKPTHWYIYLCLWWIYCNMTRNYFSGMSGGWVGGCLGGWINWKYSQLSLQLGWVGAWAELGKKP